MDMEDLQTERKDDPHRKATTDPLNRGSFQGKTNDQLVSKLNSQLNWMKGVLIWLGCIFLTIGFIFASNPDAASGYQWQGFIILMLGIILIAMYFLCWIFTPDVHGKVQEMEYRLHEDFIVLGGGSIERALLCKKCNTKIEKGDYFIEDREMRIKCSGCGKEVPVHDLPWGSDRMLKLMDKKVTEEGEEK